MLRILSTRRKRLIAVTLLALVLATGIAYRYLKTRYQLLPSGFLSLAMEIEQADFDNGLMGEVLTVLGRDHEVRALGADRHLMDQPVEWDLDTTPLTVVPWQAGIKEIAANNEIVMISENHVDSRHREWIATTLESFREAGFTHYAAEAFGESGKAIARRGFPAKQTGWYTSEPQFGNLIREAISNKFSLVDYDYGHFYSGDGREDYAANRLAGIFEKQSNAKLVVHAGPGHVVKHQSDLGESWLAARLWQKTQIEPFTILQLSDSAVSKLYLKAVELLKESNPGFTSPLLIMTPPKCALVDAILIHPPGQSTGPDSRSVAIPGAMKKLTGSWAGGMWPVVVSAYKKDEPTHAIPLDQVMLRNGESSFVLWVPKHFEFKIRVFDKNGMCKTITETEQDQFTVRFKN